MKFLIISVLLLLVLGIWGYAAYVFIEKQEEVEDKEDGEVSTQKECKKENYTQLKEYYVSNDGSDDNTGDKNNPLETLQEALCRVSSGGTVFINDGTYTESIDLEEFNIGGDEITIEGRTGEAGRRPILDGDNTQDISIYLTASENVTIKNIYFTNYTDQGLLIESSKNITVQNCKFYENGRASVDLELDGEGYGVNFVEVENALIEHNAAYNNGPIEGRIKMGILGSGINTYGLTNSIIRNNQSYMNNGNGILVEDGTNIVVERNVVRDNELDAGGDYWAGGIWLDGGKDVVIKNNVIENNNGPGLEISDEDVQSPTGYEILDNEIFSNVFGIYLWNFGICPVENISEDIVKFEFNTIEKNSEEDIACDDWACGEGIPCE